MTEATKHTCTHSMDGAHFVCPFFIDGHLHCFLFWLLWSCISMYLFEPLFSVLLGVNLGTRHLTYSEASLITLYKTASPLFSLQHHHYFLSLLRDTHDHTEQHIVTCFSTYSATFPCA